MVQKRQTPRTTAAPREDDSDGGESDAGSPSMRPTIKVTRRQSRPSFVMPTTEDQATAEKLQFAVQMFISIYVFGSCLLHA